MNTKKVTNIIEMKMHIKHTKTNTPEDCEQAPRFALEFNELLVDCAYTMCVNVKLAEQGEQGSITTHLYLNNDNDIQ